MDTKFQRINTEKGLSQSGVSDILQDDLGFMWFSTQYGLNRFDGKTYDYFYADDTRRQTISSNHITRLTKDSQFRIWVMSSHGLDSINQKTLEIKNWSRTIFDQLIEKNIIDKKNQGTISDFQVDERFLYVLLNFKTLIKLDLATEKLELVQLAQDTIQSINGILLLDNEELLIHSNNCFYFYDAVTITQKKKHCPKISLYNQRFQSNSLQGDKLFLNYINGLYVLNYKTLQEELIKILDSKSQENIENTVALEVENGYWLGSIAGLKFYDSNLKTITREYFHESSDDFSLSNNDVLSIYKSKDGILWVGTSFGLSMLKPKQYFGHLLRKTETETFKLSNLATSLSEDSNGDLWIGTSSSGLYKYSNNKALLENFTSLDEKASAAYVGFVSKVFEDDNQNLWVLAESGLSVKGLSQNKFKTLETFEANGKKYALSYMLDIIQDRYSGYWLGSSAGLFKLEIATFENGELDLSIVKAVNYKDKLPQNYLDGDYGIYVLYEDLQGYIWAGGTNGLVRFNPSNLTAKHYSHDPDNSSSLSSSDVNTIYEDYNGVLWIGTTNGLNRVYYSDSGAIRFKRVGVSDGFASNYISAIQADKDGFLWLATINGVTRYHPSNIEPVVNYLYEQGLQHNEFYTKAGYTDDEGQIYFGGVNGLSVFDPLKLGAQRETKAIQFSSVSQNEHNYELDKTNLIKLIDNLPTKVRVSNFDYLSNRNLKLRYRLSEQEPWIETVNNEIVIHKITKTTKLEVQQQTAAGTWLAPGIRLTLVNELKILSFNLFWPLLRLLSICVIVATVYWLYMNLNRQKKDKDLMFKREKAKQSLLMEEKLSLLHQVEDLHYSLSEQKYLVDKIQNELEQKNIKDELTNLLSRGYIIKNIQHELENIKSTWQLATQNGIYLGVFCVEIDNFNALKEQHGFIALNEILTQVAESITNICYGSDIIARWQGASILILSRGISKREQMVLAEKIRNIIASRKFDLSNGKTIDITASIGFSRYPFLSTTSDKDINWSKLIFLTETALSSAQTNSLNAWIGIFSNQFTDGISVEDGLLNKLPDLVNSGQLDYVSSIPKSKKIQWD